MKKSIVLIVLTVLAGIAGRPAAAAEMPQPETRYVFFFIGDGMGPAQRFLAEAAAGRPLAINHLPVTGLTTTHCANRYITDSAAAGTALAAGVKTAAGVIGFDADGQRVESVAELARRNGRKVGIVTSASCDHATPAAFYAHVPKRSQYDEIARQLPDSGFDFFGGGGFLKPGDLRERAAARGYRWVNDAEELRRLKPAAGKVIAVAPRLDDEQSMPYVLDRRPGDPTLADFTAKAIEMLEQPDGFFLMVEGGKIDWAAHANDAAAVVAEVLDFDAAVAVALRFAEKHPDDTLIVVTADHETGGLTLGCNDTGYDTFFNRLAAQRQSKEKFSREKVRSAAGFDAIVAAAETDFGIQPDTAERQQLANAFRALRQAAATAVYGSSDPVTDLIIQMAARRAGIGWTTTAHTGIPVVTTAAGKGAAAFGGLIDNTEIGRRLKQAVGGGADVR